MKKFIVLSLLSSFLFIDIACKKITEDVIDCLTESWFLSINASIDQTNDKLVHFEFVNSDSSGDYVLEPNINWDFGDGNKVSSTNHTIDHTYSSSGTYKITAAYTLSKGSSTCSSTKEKTVTIN